MLVKGLGGATRDRCVFVVLRLLPEIAQQQRAWLDKCIQPPASNATNARAQPMPCALSPERLCAYINNHRRFVSLLEQLEKSICVGVDGETASSIHDGTCGTTISLKFSMSCFLVSSTCVHMCFN